ncbi:hypothetical protein F0U61_03355 [Archangium violaceum]|uniref:hypothetical protein n=1 Tax=Archangium violaceum TaxID=83451 RepID=UPI002B2C44E8|nr:hypothetical protein F0U61_03355 [Archangium violaceum]
MLAGYFVSFIVAALLAAACAHWPHTVGRSLVAVVFLLASAVNGMLALLHPQLYVEGFGPTAIPLYQAFIEGPFAQNPALFVLPIALGQFLCGLGVLLGRGVWARLALVGCIVFLVAITGLGVGCAFPANLAMALSPALLLRHRFPHGAPHAFHRRHHTGAGLPAGR